MFEHYTFGAEAKHMPRRSRELSPRDLVGPDEQYEQRQYPSPPLSATTVSPSTGTRHDSETTPDSIDSLAQELSRQNLQLDRANLEQLQYQLSLPPPPPLTLSPRISMSPLPPCPELEIDDDPESHLDLRLGPPGLPPIPSYASLSSAMDVDHGPIMPDMKRLRRQRSSHPADPSPTTRARTLTTLVEGMLSRGGGSSSQCTMRRASSPSPSPLLTPTSGRRLATIPEPPASEDNNTNNGRGNNNNSSSSSTAAGLDIGSSVERLEVDDAYAAAAEGDEALLQLEGAVPLRRAGGPAGIRKAGALQWRASAEAALSCANVVRNRPRMRRRSKRHLPHHHRASRPPSSSMASSEMASSAFSSPVMAPSLPDVPLAFRRI